MVFVPELTLTAAANVPGLQLAVGSGNGSPPADEQTVRTSFTEAGQQFDVILPIGPVHGAALALPWIVLACGLVLAGLASALGLNAARRARAQNELDRIFNLSTNLIAVTASGEVIDSTNSASPSSNVLSTITPSGTTTRMTT